MYILLKIDTDSKPSILFFVSQISPITHSLNNVLFLF